MSSRLSPALVRLIMAGCCVLLSALTAIPTAAGPFVVA